MSLHQYLRSSIVGLLVMASVLCLGQVPENDNKTDRKGRRQGTWTLFYDDSGQLNERDSALYYRIISYKNDLPIGVVKDYYLDGTLQFEGQLKADRPEEILDGKCFYYSSAGILEAEVNYDKGEFISYVALDSEGNPIDDPAMDLKTRGIDLIYQQEKYEEGIKDLIDSKIKAKYEFGRFTTEYLETVYTLGQTYRNYEKYKEAEPLLIEGMEIYKKALGDKDPTYGQSLYELGKLYLKAEDFPKAEQALKLSEEVASLNVISDSVAYLDLVYDLADVYGMMSDYREALPRYEIFTELAIALYGVTSDSYIIGLNEIAKAQSHLGEYASSEKHFLDLLRLVDQKIGKENNFYPGILTSLGRVYRSTGEVDKAIETVNQKMELDAKMYGEQSSEYAQSMNNLAELYSDIGAFQKAEYYYNESLSYLDKSNSDPTYAHLLGNIANYHSIIGEYDSAEYLYKESNRLRREYYGEGSAGHALGLNNLAMLYYRRGNFIKAEPIFLQNYKTYKELYGKINPYYANTTNNLAALYSDMGNGDQALQYYEEAREIKEELYGTDNVEYATALNNSGLEYYEQGDTLLGKEYILESFKIYLRKYGENHPETTVAMANLGGIYRGIKEYDSSLYYLNRSIEIDIRLFGEKHLTLATHLSSLSSTYEELEDLEKAELYLKKAADIRLELNGPNDRIYSNYLGALANIHYKQNRFDLATDYYKESLSIQRKIIDYYFPTLSEVEKAAFYRNTIQKNFKNFESYVLDRYREEPELLNTLFDHHLKTKAILLSSSNRLRNAILRSNDDDLISLYREWKAKRDFLGKSYQLTESERKSKGILIDELESEVNELEKKLNTSSQQFSVKSQSGELRWTDIRHQLKENEVAIEVIRTEINSEDEKLPVYAFLLIRKSTKNNPEIIIIRNADQLETRSLNYYRNSLREKIKDEYSYNSYWAPINKELEGIRKVYFSADGVYNQLNLNSLFNPSTGNYLMDDTDIIMVSSTRDLVGRTGRRDIKIQNVTLFGYPNYSNDSVDTNLTKGTTKNNEANRFFQGGVISDLPGTKVEVESIETLLRNSGIEVSSYLYDDASESSIKALESPQVLHIATHGYFLSGGSSLEEGYLGMEADVVEKNELLRSGLLFSGASNIFNDNKVYVEDEDGVLTAFEAMNLNLDKTELVILSACETGLGVNTNGEGVYGLQRAFQVSGAKTILMSLWKVSDEATRELMTSYYSNWVKGNSPREAFRLAQYTLREKYPSPYYWGAFVMVGD